MTDILIDLCLPTADTIVYIARFIVWSVVYDYGVW